MTGTGQPPTRTASRKRRRTPRSDWQFPLLTDWGLRPEQQRLLVIIASVLGVVAGACGLAAVLLSVGGDYVSERRASAAVGAGGTGIPASYQGWAASKLFDPIADRAKDAKPLTEKEVFATRTLAGEKKFRLKVAAKQLDADCAAALWGEALLQLVADAECSQAARGLYTTADGRYVGQYTLLNLRDAQAAAELVEELKTGYRGGWTRPLTTPGAAFPADGHTEAAGYALGHYVGLVWYGRADGAQPSARDDFVSLAITLRGAEKAVYRRVVTITGPAS